MRRTLAPRELSAGARRLAGPTGPEDLAVLDDIVDDDHAHRICSTTFRVSCMTRMLLCYSPLIIHMQSSTPASEEGWYEQGRYLAIEDLARHCSTEHAFISVADFGINPSTPSGKTASNRHLRHQSTMLINPTVGLEDAFGRIGLGI
jgi:hypothetical protein